MFSWYFLLLEGHNPLFYEDDLACENVEIFVLKPSNNFKREWELPIFCRLLSDIHLKFSPSEIICKSHYCE